MEAILVFGAGELQCSMINTVKNMGFRAVVIDPDPLAEGAGLADVFFCIAADDYEGTRKIAQDFRVVALVTTATDNPLPMMARLAEELGLRFPSYDSVMSVLDKGRFKKLLMDNNIPCAKGKTYAIGEFPDYSKLDYPVIIKPNRNSGSRGVVKCNSTAELEDEIDKVRKYCKDGKYIIEDWITSDEISVEGFVQNGKLTIVQITDKLHSIPPYNIKIANIQPSKYLYRIDDVYAILQKVVDLTGLNNCPIHPELKISDEHIHLIEMGPRLGGGYITSDLVPLTTGVNMEKDLIRVAMGQQISSLNQVGAAMTQFIVFPPGTILKNPTISKDIMDSSPSVVKIRMYMSLGQKSGIVTNDTERHGFYVIKGDCLEDLCVISQKVMQRILRANQ